MTDLAMVQAELVALETFQTRVRPKSPDFVNAAFSLARDFTKIDASDRSVVLASVTDQLRKKLWAASLYMTEMAIDRDDSTWLEAALVMHVLDNFEFDSRDNIRYLVLVAFASKQLGFDYRACIDRIIGLAAGHGAKQLMEFSARPDAVNTLENFHVRLDVIDGRSQFVSLD
jgi:hypothetical protein